MTFGLGKLTHMGILKTKWGKKAEKSEENRAGMLALQKYGWPVIPLSFLTVGFQTVVQLAAGMLDWKWSKYTNFSPSRLFSSACLRCRRPDLIPLDC